MTSLEIREGIRKIVEENLPGSRVLLFGSRAKGYDDQYSDYDLLIITPNTIPPREKIRWNTIIDTAIVKRLNVPADILIDSEEEVNRKKELFGHIVRTAVEKECRCES